MKSLILFILCPYLLLSQGEFDQWRFGYNAGIDFSAGYAVVVSSGVSISSPEAAASVSDCDGDLLFYTDGQDVWAKNNNRMENGYDLRGVGAAYPSSQGTIIVKRPQSSSIYYIFTSSDIFGVNYSIVNMAANGGLGSVIQKNINLSSGLTQKLGVTYHGNGKDIWVITHYENSDVYEAFLVTQTGIGGSSVKSSTGPVFTSSHGDIKFNQSGTKIAAVVQDQDLITLADFNKNTGKVSNSFGVVGDIKQPHGCEFSPDDTKMYVSAWDVSPSGGVFQFRTLSSNFSSLMSPAKVSESYIPNGSLQLAPDGKIYISNDGGFFGNSYLGIINFPNNSPGNIGFNDRGINLGSGSSSWELPNVTLTNNDIPVSKSILSSQFCFGDSTLFSLSNNSGLVEVLWDFDDPNSGISNFSSILSPSHVFSEPGIYTINVKVTNVCNIEEYSQIITIQELPELSLDSMTVCPDLSVQIGRDSELGIAYNWSPGLGLSNTEISNPFFKSSDIESSNIEYVLEATSSNGCSFSDTLKIKLNPKFIGVPDVYLCPGFGVTLFLDSAIKTANWESNVFVNDLSSLSPYVNPDIPTNFIVDLIDSNNCYYSDTIFVNALVKVPVSAGIDKSVCFSDSITIGEDISPDSSLFNWSPIEGISNSSSAVTQVSPISSQWYYVTVTNDTCSASDSVYVLVNDLPNINLLPIDTSICMMDTAFFSVTGSENYNWFINDSSVLASNKYELIIKKDLVAIVEGQDLNGCSAYDTSIIKVLALPVVSLTTDTSICIGDSIILKASGGIDYLWSESSFGIDSVIEFTPEKTNVYSVKVVGSNSCYDVDSVSVVVNDLPTIELMSDTLICEGSRANLWARGGVVYEWSPDLYLDRNLGSDVISLPIDPITYKVVVVDSNQCVDSMFTSVDINVNPIANFNYNILPVCEGLGVQFSDSSELADNFSWVFGDGFYSIEKNPYHVFGYNSNTITSLIIGNNDVCYDTLTMDFNWLEISNVIDVFVPNIITPNNDGINDCLTITAPSEFESCTSLIVYNRWGMKVFDSSLGFHQNFCGYNAYNNNALSEGTYFYTVKVGDYSLNGFVSIIK